VTTYWFKHAAARLYNVAKYNNLTYIHTVIPVHWQMIHKLLQHPKEKNAHFHYYVFHS